MPAEPSISPAAPASRQAPRPSGSRGVGLAASAGLIAFATATSRVLGLVRDQVLAYYFGAGHAMDAYNVAFRIPNLLRDLFAEGAMSAALVPTFTRARLESEEGAWRLGRLVITALSLVTLVLAILGMVFSRPLVSLFAEHYAAVPGKLELATALARTMFPFLPMVALAAACMGMLNALRRFFVPAMSPAMFNVGSIVTLVVLVPVFQRVGVHPIYAAAVGTLVGGLGQVGLQWAVLRHEGFRFRPAIDTRDPRLREVLALMVPGMIGLAAVQVNVLVNMLLATSQGAGAISWLGYAFRLMYMPIGLFGLSVATAAIPSISTHAAKGDLAGIRGTLSSGLRMMLMLNVPATVGLIVLARPIVSLLFERGSFSPADTAATAAALVWYAPGLVGYSAVKIAVPTFYALRDSRTPVLISAFSVGINLAINLSLVQVLGYRGLALGTAAAAVINGGVLLFMLRKRLEGFDEGRIGLALFKILVASAVMGLAVWTTEHALERTLTGTATLARLVRVLVEIAAGLGTLAAAARLLRIAEFSEAFRAVAAKVSGQSASR